MSALGNSTETPNKDARQAARPVEGRWNLEGCGGALLASLWDEAAATGLTVDYGESIRRVAGSRRFKAFHRHRLCGSHRRPTLLAPASQGPGLK